MNNHLWRLLPFLIVAITTTSSSNNRVGYDDPCSKTIKCKSQSWLVCNPVTSKCDCSKPSEMIYNSAIDKCVVVIGERCKYGFGFDDDVLGPLYERLDCVDGAICDSNDGICACPIDTYEDVEESKCLPLKVLGDVCQSSTECSYTLTCLNRTCNCATEDMIFESTSAECRVKAGKFCSSSDCVDGSECVDHMCTCVAGMYMRSGECLQQKGLGSICNSDIECNDVQMLNCINKTCACRDGYSKTSRGLCGLAYGQDCSREKVCSDEFFCTQQSIVGTRHTKCLCPDTDLQMYDGNACVGVVGGYCGPKMECTKNAYCQNNVCNCVRGFVENDRNECDVAYGFVCDPIYGILCDRLAGLVCKQIPNDSEFRCRCSNEHDSFLADSRKCFRGSSYTCKDHSDCMNNHCYENTKRCN